MNKRLEYLLSAENLSQSQFADTIGVTRASVSNILGGRNKPSYEFITAVLNHFPNLNSDWLLTGRGKMYNDGAPISPQESIFPAPQGDQGANIAFSEGHAPSPANSKLSENQRTIVKIIVYYDDNTFEELSK